MPDTRCRKLTVVLAAGALSVFGAAGAFAAESSPAEGGGGGGGGGANPACSGTPLSTTPLCAPQGQQSPDHGGLLGVVPLDQGGDEKGGGEDGTGGDSDGKGGDPITPGDGNNPLCVGAYGVPPPLCPEPGEGESPSSNAPTIVPAQSGGEEDNEKGGGEDGEGGDSDGKGGDPISPGDGNNPLCAGTLAGTPLCPSQPGEGPPDGQGGDGGGTGSGGSAPSA